MVVTEASLPIRSVGESEGITVTFEWNLGLMVNVASRSAVGALLISGGDEEDYWGGGLRYRHWLEAPAAADLTVGVVNTGGSGADRASLRPHISVALSLGDIFGLSLLGIEDRGDPRLGLGPRFGSWAGLVLGAAYLALRATIPPS